MNVEHTLELAIGDRLPLPMDGLTIRIIYPEDFPRERDLELIELLRRAFNGGPMWFRFDVEPVDHLRWKLRDFPGTALLKLTEDGDTPVAMIVYDVHRYLSQGKEVMVGEEVDSATEPPYQGRGIRSAGDRLSKRWIPGTPWFAYTIANGAHPLSSRRLGKTGESQLMGNPLLTLAKVISPSRLIWSQISSRVQRNRRVRGAGSRTREVLEARGIGSRAPRSARLKAALMLLGATVSSSLRRSPHGSWTIRTTHQFDQRADRFWERAHDQFDVIQIRDRDYLNWRFCDPRAGGFVVRTAEEDGELLGYLALRITGQTAVIADLLALPGRSDVVGSLLDDAASIALQAGAASLRCWSVAGHPYLASLKRAGFAAYPNTMGFNYNGWARSLSELTFLSDPATRIHYQPADTDHA